MRQPLSRRTREDPPSPHFPGGPLRLHVSGGCLDPFEVTSPATSNRPTDLETSAALRSHNQAWRLRTQGPCLSLLDSFLRQHYSQLAKTQMGSSLLYWL